ncbi:hypothetical protein [Nocardia sp. XZ_19_231]|uniref:hypothetical protein n=1 Tax=Nocardia sp. XZ_19_231 TaxID=2769252 RepID=UPI00188E0175|nr:hypothetical protein [Nocardia sp. XZ_19_231]
MTGPHSGAGTLGESGRDDAVLLDRRQIAHACDQIVPTVEFLREPIGQWGGLRGGARLSAAQRAYLGGHALAILDTVLIDLAAVRARMATALAVPSGPLPDPGTDPWPPRDLSEPARYVARDYERAAAQLRYISISLDQWAARTPDHYNEAARTSAGVRALDYLDSHIVGFGLVRAALAADLAGPDPANALGLDAIPVTRHPMPTTPGEPTS